MDRLELGEHTIELVLDSVVRGDPTKIYPGTSQPMWSAHGDLLEADGTLQLSVGAYLLRSGDRRVLIDLGVGPDDWQAPSGAVIPGGNLPERLRNRGIDPAEITDVVFSHLHPDHIGWSSRDGAPRFENATYRCHVRDWEFFVEGEQADPWVRERLLPIAGRFETWDGDRTLFPGVDVLGAPGHTPGNAIVALSSVSGPRAVLLGDVVHCPVELIDDEWATIGDVDPALAQRTRIRLARELEGTDVQVSAAHFPELRFGRLLVGDDRRRVWG